MAAVPRRGREGGRLRGKARERSLRGCGPDAAGKCRECRRVHPARDCPPKLREHGPCATAGCRARSCVSGGQQAPEPQHGPHRAAPGGREERRVAQRRRACAGLPARRREPELPQRRGEPCAPPAAPPANPPSTPCATGEQPAGGARGSPRQPGSRGEDQGRACRSGNRCPASSRRAPSSAGQHGTRRGRGPPSPPAAVPTRRRESPRAQPHPHRTCQPPSHWDTCCASAGPGKTDRISCR